METQDRREPGTEGGSRSDAAAVLGIAGYDELVEVGRGGFGVVYRAVQPDLARVVAIKVLTSNALDERARHRFDRERQVLGMLGAHPHIISVFQSGYAEGHRPYIVMEYMPGGSLAAHIEALGPLAWPEVVDVGVKVAGALHNAHLAGVLHRDLKPDNILVSAFGEPVLADFGIAAVTGVNTSRTGNLMASVAYAAPEVLEGKRTTAATDVYSFGATLFALLAAHAPHWRATDESVIPVVTRILTEPPPDLRARGVPADVCDVVERSLAKDPVDRFASAEDLGRALQAVQRAHDLSPTALVFSLTALERAGTGITGPVPGAATPTPSGIPAGLPWLDRIRGAAPSWTPTPTPGAPTPASPSRIDGPARAWTPVPPLPFDDAPPDDRPSDASPSSASTDASPSDRLPGDRPSEVAPVGAASTAGPASGDRRRLALVGAAAASVLGVGALIWALSAGGEGSTTTTTVPAAGTATTSGVPATATTPAPTGSTAGPTATAPATKAVPDVSAQFASPDAVAQALVTAGFSATRVPTVSSTVPSGTVIGLDPAAGTPLAPGASVKVLVSTGSADAEVPKVDGFLADAAQQALEAKGFVVRRELVENPFTEAGVAIDTVPAAGTSELKGAPVVLRISAGPTPATPVTAAPPVTSAPTGPTTPPTAPPTSPPTSPPVSGPRVPNIVGLSAPAANARLQAEGFAGSRRADVCSATMDGLVVSQTPGSGPADAGATVFFSVGSSLLC